MLIGCDTFLQLEKYALKSTVASMDPGEDEQSSHELIRNLYQSAETSYICKAPMRK